jgi:hypothetical protein
MSELRDNFLEHYDAVFRVAVCCILCLPSFRTLSTLRSPTAFASCYLSVQVVRGAFESGGVYMSDGVRANILADHSARCGDDTPAHTAHSWLVTALAETISDVLSVVGIGFEGLSRTQRC